VRDAVVIEPALELGLVPFVICYTVFTGIVSVMSGNPSQWIWRSGHDLRGVPNQPSAATLVARAATAKVVNEIFMVT
jgi:hypothetical protein